MTKTTVNPRSALVLAGRVGVVLAALLLAASCSDPTTSDPPVDPPVRPGRLTRSFRHEIRSVIII